MARTLEERKKIALTLCDQINKIDGSLISKPLEGRELEISTSGYISIVRKASTMNGYRTAYVQISKHHRSMYDAFDFYFEEKDSSISWIIFLKDQLELSTGGCFTFEPTRFQTQDAEWYHRYLYGEEEVKLCLPKKEDALPEPKSPIISNSRKKLREEMIKAKKERKVKTNIVLNYIPTKKYKDLIEGIEIIIDLGYITFQRIGTGEILFQWAINNLGSFHKLLNEAITKYGEEL